MPSMVLDLAVAKQSLVILDLSSTTEVVLLTPLFLAFPAHKFLAQLPMEPELKSVPPMDKALDPVMPSLVTPVFN